MRVRGFGPRRVREGLARRRLPREIVDEASAAVFADGEAPLARESLRRWERAKGPARGRGAAATPRTRTCCRRGFSTAAARAALFNRTEIE